MRALLLVDDDAAPGTLAQVLDVLAACGVTITPLPMTTLDIQALARVGLNQREIHLLTIGEQTRWDYAAMAGMTGYTVTTVRTYMHRLFARFHVTNRRGLAQVLARNFATPRACCPASTAARGGMPT